MPLPLLLDENVRGLLWQAIGHHNAAGTLPLDTTRVGDPPDLPLGSADDFILTWCERTGRLLVSLDRQTIPGYVARHLAGGGHLPGVVMIRPRATLGLIKSELVLIAHAGDPDDYRDTVTYIP